jgi:hypothetical protein
MATATKPSTSPSTILSPRILVQKEGSGDGVECSVHTLPKPLLREFQHVFRDTYLRGLEIGANCTNANNNDMNVDAVTSTTNTSTDEKLELLAIPTNQRAREDLVAVGDHIEQEKDRLLNVVSLFFEIF